MKMWMIVSVESETDWPAKEQSFDFNGREVILRPPREEDAAADVRTEYVHPEGEKDALGTVFQFLSLVSWWYDCPVFARSRRACTSPTLRLGKNRVGPILQHPYLGPEIRMPANPKEKLALSLYREARSIRSIPYEFLGYFKIININYKKSKAQEDWINRTASALSNTDARKRLTELSTEPNIGHYLYESGRCAVAHAFEDPIVDPDNPADLIRLSADMPVARALAEYLIKKELGISRLYN